MSRRARVLVALALAGACLLLYAPAIGYGFVNYDDNSYVTDNPWVRAGFTAAGVRWAFTTIEYFHWQPLAWLSHMADCQIYGLWPGGHHLTSLLLHLLNTLLVFAVLRRLTGAPWRSATAAAIFGLHPLRIESVVWIAEHKDLLCGLFFLCAIWLYLRYVERPSRFGYYLVLAAFVLGLMTKPMVMTLPLVLLLLDWWPLHRRAFAEKVPMLGLACLSAFVTSIGTGRMGIINWGSTLTWQERAANTLVSYVRYLELSVWPHDLAVLYPFRLAIPGWQLALSALLLAGITLAALWQAPRRPYLIVGWLWFALMLVPASGLVTQVGRQGMADRFTYLPHIGLALAVVWGTADLLGNRRRAAIALGVAVPAALAVAGARHLPVWHDSIALFSNAVAVTGENSGAQHYLAAALDDAGRYEEALPHHAESVRLEPGYFVAQASYGAALARRGELEGAVRHLRAALRTYPAYPDAQRLLEENQKLLDLSKASGLKLKSER